MLDRLRSMGAEARPMSVKDGSARARVCVCVYGANELNISISAQEIRVSGSVSV